MTSGDATEPQEPASATGQKPSVAEGKSTGEKPARAKTVKPAIHGQGGVVPKTAAEDDPRSWGDRESDNSHDAWLKEQKPPHWG